MSSSGDGEASTCGWRRPAGSCEPVARSCAECLNVVPTSGEECKLLPLSGMCVRADLSADGEDVWSVPVIPDGNGSLVQMNLPPLLSNSSDYCAADDSECAACLRTADTTSSVCYGASGCVCLGACASEAWDATAALLLPAVLANEPFNSSDCAVVVGDEDINAETGRAASSPNWLDTTSDNECLWAPPTNIYRRRACQNPRSCYDCLNTPLDSGTKCTVTPQGLCTTMDAYDYLSDYRLNASAHAPHFFPSSNTTYCEADDTTCRACRTSPPFVAGFQNRQDQSAFCVGAGGCVCIGFCDSSNYDEMVLDMLCDSSLGREVDPASIVPPNSLRIIGLIVALCIAVPVVAVVWCGKRAQRAARARALAWRNRPPANGPLLGLEGWKKFREELIEQEQRTLQGEGGDGDEARPTVSVTIELQRPMAVANATRESETDEQREDEEEAEQKQKHKEEEEEEKEEETDVEGETAYVPMTDREDERRQSP